MRQRRFYHLSKLLNGDERDEFSDFLNSPYHNKSRVLVDFWDHWQAKVLDQESGADLSIAEFLQDTDLKQSRFNKMCSTIAIKAREFLALQSYKERPQLQRQLTAAGILERDPQLTYYQKFLKPIYKKMSEVKASPKNYLYQFSALSEYSQALTRTRRKDIDWEEVFKNLLSGLELFYQSKRLQLATGVINSSHVFRVGELATENAIGSPISKIYGTIFSLQSGDGGIAELEELLKVLEQFRDEIEDEILFDMYSHMMNFCIRQINASNLKFQGPSFRLYMILLEQGQLFRDDHLPVQHFKNIVTLGTRLGRLETVRQLIQDYISKILPEHRPLALAYNEAIVQFYEGKFLEVIRRLNQLELSSETDIFYGLDARSYLWKAYYETFDELSREQVDDMDRHYNSFRLYIQRNERLSDLQKTQYSNFIRWFNRLLNIRKDPKSNRYEMLLELREKVNAGTNIQSKSWIVDKINVEIKTTGQSE